MSCCRLGVMEWHHCRCSVALRPKEGKGRGMETRSEATGKPKQEMRVPQAKVVAMEVMSSGEMLGLWYFQSKANRYS